MMLFCLVLVLMIVSLSAFYCLIYGFRLAAANRLDPARRLKALTVLFTALFFETLLLLDRRATFFAIVFVLLLLDTYVE
eukprot:TRINITY_DN5432_c0_g1_i1.p1 TRINITY_DN5432_c0_g1~~TRINITY_DN5432_c0_g1_i1.p1  ORF type:complete len:79 (-),score=8.05 TRINITY_DN5432_c0_g1_i1:47-283(-)